VLFSKTYTTYFKTIKSICVKEVKFCYVISTAIYHTVLERINFTPQWSGDCLCLHIRVDVIGDMTARWIYSHDSPLEPSALVHEQVRRDSQWTPIGQSVQSSFEGWQKRKKYSQTAVFNFCKSKVKLSHYCHAGTKGERNIAPTPSWPQC
jgi:hypothetical protein